MKKYITFNGVLATNKSKILEDYYYVNLNLFLDEIPLYDGGIMNFIDKIAYDDFVTSLQEQINDLAEGVKQYDIFGKIEIKEIIVRDNHIYIDLQVGDTGAKINL